MQIFSIICETRITKTAVIRHVSELLNTPHIYTMLLFSLYFQNVLKKKIEAIVDCYLDTASPPWLQVRH